MTLTRRLALGITVPIRCSPAPTSGILARHDAVGFRHGRHQHRRDPSAVGIISPRHHHVERASAQTGSV